MLIDSHCHLDRLDLSRHNHSLDDALDAARRRGVKGFLCIGIGRANASQVVDISDKYPDVYATVGLHPLEFSESPAPDLSAIEAWLDEAVQHPRVVGVGETGLDYYYSSEHIEAQQASFSTHLRVAARHKKPVIVHSREARRDTIDLIKRFGESNSGVLHCFTENWELAKAALDLNYYISFSGIITFKNAANLREIAAKIPLNRLLVETDSPYLAPIPHRGHPNEPAYVVEVAKCLAELQGIPYERLCEATGANFSRLFGVV